ncbi:tetratricopeptide repeat protein [Rhodospirillum sp. A1_3_36]|uniref:tetratricopeptide repeat protein n=1 Tax=Rhodospirillum sp. A1_3_36 TaxID=3391666 RepID=UPI0039A5FE74
MTSIRILHISDLHARAATSWRDRRVLGDAWEKNLAQIMEDGPPDLVCFTGDIAQSGQEKDYETASVFLDHLLGITKLPKDRLFLVPGNHDVDRSKEEAAFKKFRSKDYLSLSSDALGSWLYDERAPRGCTQEDLEAVLRRRDGYHAWLKAWGVSHCLHGGSDTRPGYRHSLTLPGFPMPLHIIGLDTAWLAGDDNDNGKLYVTTEQVGTLSSDGAGNPLGGFRLALAHHPLDWLADQMDVKRLLADRVDLLLCGHVHDADIGQTLDPDRTLRQWAAGCLYERDTYPNSMQVIDLHPPAAEGEQAAYTLWFRQWSPRGHWHATDSLYSGSNNGRLTIGDPTKPTPSCPPHHPGVERLFVGRDEELAQLETALLPKDGRAPRPCVVHGMGGVGKSYLVDRFYSQTKAHFPGGYIRVTLTDQMEATEEAILGLLAAMLNIQAGTAALPGLVADRIGRAHPLVHVENVDTPALAQAMVDLVDRLGTPPLVVSARSDAIGGEGHWADIPLFPFDQTHALDLIAQEMGILRPTADTPDTRALVDALGHLPLALHIVGARLRKGLGTATTELETLRQRNLAVGPPNRSDPLWKDRARAVIAHSLDLSLSVLKAELVDDALFAGFLALGHGPEAGFTRALGAVVADLEPLAISQVLEAAQDLSLVLPEIGNQSQPRWKLHVLLMEHLRNRSKGSPPPWKRIADWIAGNLRGSPESWSDTLDPDHLGLLELLTRMPEEEARPALRPAQLYARQRGPYGVWRALFLRAAEAEETPDGKRLFLYRVADLYQYEGDPEGALSAAEETRGIKGGDQEDRDLALSWGVTADILTARGQYDDALRIRQEEEIPVYERLGDVRERAVSLGKIADILMERGQLDDALRVRREEELPVYERIGDVRERTVTLGQIADILMARGQLDDALRIRQEEELPVYERIGDVRERAVTLGKIADILMARGQLDDALRIRQEDQLPVYERIGDVRSRAVTLGKIADILMARGQLDDALRIRQEEELPVYERIGDIDSIAATYWEIASIFKRQGKPEEAAPLVERAYEILQKTGRLDGICVVGQDYGQRLFESGRIEEGRRVLRRSIDGFRQLERESDALDTERLLEDLEARHGGTAPGS